MEVGSYTSYAENLDWVYNLKNRCTMPVLHSILSDYDIYESVFTLSADTRAKIMGDCHIGYQTMNRAIEELKSVGALLPFIRVNPVTGEQHYNKSRLLVNPRMFWSRDEASRQEFIRRMDSMN